MEIRGEGDPGATETISAFRASNYSSASYSVISDSRGPMDVVRGSRLRTGATGRNH